MKRLLIVTCFATLFIACGGKGGGNGGDDAGGGGGDGTGGPTADAATPVQCTGGPIPGNPQCSNCIDDDGDGRIDSLDIECTGPQDNDESSFKTGLPGDNVDPKHQDCFFDGDSGAGNDGCDIHTCCLLGAATVDQCPANLRGGYDPQKCPPPIGTGMLSTMCQMTCGKATPPGCDCFGCCTICDAAGCVTVMTNPAAAPNCTGATIHDPTKCPVCTPIPSCSNPCGGTTCILCPGEDPSMLPASCNGTSACPANSKVCTVDTDCGSGAYCDAGSKCCVGIIQ
jgi:hypothetical protein